MAETGRHIGFDKCRACGANVRLKASAKGSVYYYCDGQAHPGMCGHHERYGPWKSREIVERLAKMETEQGSKDDGQSQALGPKPPQRGAATRAAAATGPANDNAAGAASGPVNDNAGGAGKPVGGRKRGTFLG